MSPIDFAVPIMNDLVSSIQTGRERTMIPFTRFTKLLVEYFCKDTPEFIKRMSDPNESKHLLEDDFTISFIKTTTSSTKNKGMRLPEYLLDDKIKKSLNYKFYINSYTGVQEEATRQTRSKGSLRSGSTVSATESQPSKSKRTPTTKPATKPKPTPTPKPKPATKSSKKESTTDTPQDKSTWFRRDPTPTSSDNDSEFDTETDDEVGDYERRVRIPEAEFPELEIATQQSLETFEAEQRKRKGITINEPDDTDEAETIVEPLVDKRRLKSIVVDTRAEDKQLLKDQRNASLHSRIHPQPSSQPIHEGTTSSSTVPLIESTTLVPSNRVEDKDPEGNTTMTDAVDTEERVDEQEQEPFDTHLDFDPFITPEYVAQEEERRRKETEEKEAFDTNLFLQSTSQSKQTASEQPPHPEASPPKDPSPPASSSSSHNESSSESSPEHSSPKPSETVSKQQSVNEPPKPVDLQEQVNSLTTMVTKLAKQVEDFQESKQKIDQFLQADLDGLIRTFTYDYLTDNLVEMITPEVANLLEPINDNLDHRIRSVVRKMLSTTPFTLHTEKAITAAPAVPELSFNDMLAKLFDNIASKTTQTAEEKALYDAMVAYISKESCKDAAGTLKRSRKDDDPDPNSKGKKPKSGTGPSSSQQPQQGSTPPENPQQPPASGTSPKDHEEQLMDQTEDYHDQPDTEHPASQSPDTDPRPKRKVK
jgi:hypothetical protein